MSLLPLRWIRMSLRDRPAACICSSDFSRLRNPCSKGTQYGVAITILDHDWSFYYSFVLPLQTKTVAIPSTLKSKPTAKGYWLVTIKKFAIRPSENGLYLNAVKGQTDCEIIFAKW